MPKIDVLRMPAEMHLEILKYVPSSEIYKMVDFAFDRETLRDAIWKRSVGMKGIRTLVRELAKSAQV